MTDYDFEGASEMLLALRAVPKTKRLDTLAVVLRSWLDSEPNALGQYDRRWARFFAHRGGRP